LAKAEHREKMTGWRPWRRSRFGYWLASGFALVLVGWSLAAAAADLSPAGNPWVTIRLGEVQVRV
jgi:hypothetical protein